MLSMSYTVPCIHLVQLPSEKLDIVQGTADPSGWGNIFLHELYNNDIVSQATTPMWKPRVAHHESAAHCSL